MDTAANWTSPNGVIPSGGDSASITAGVLATVETATPTYSGGLTLNAGSELRVGWAAHNSLGINALGTGSITMNSGSKIDFRSGANLAFANAFTLAGDAQIHGGSSGSELL